MQAIDQRDRELMGALQNEIPLVSTPFALIGQSIDMSEKEVIKRENGAQLDRDVPSGKLAYKMNGRRR